MVLPQATLSPTPPPFRPGPPQLLFIFLLYGERPSQSAVGGGGGCRDREQWQDQITRWSSAPFGTVVSLECRLCLGELTTLQPETKGLLAAGTGGLPG